MFCLCIIFTNAIIFRGQISLKPSINDAFRKIGKISSFGFVVGIGVMISILAGNWLDGKMGTSPVFTLLFPGLTLLGIGIEFFRWVNTLDRNSENESDEPEEHNEETTL